MARIHPSLFSAAALISALAFVGMAAPARADKAAAPPKGWATATPSAADAAAAKKVVTGRVATRTSGEAYYQRVYGVDHLQVHSLGSGFTLEFRYRVVDTDKARVLSDKKVKPVMVDQKTGNRLEVPTIENVGNLRQTATQEAGREYWMIFANAGRLVKPGQRVDVRIGTFHAEGLTVE